MTMIPILFFCLVLACAVMLARYRGPTGITRAGLRDGLDEWPT